MDSSQEHITTTMLLQVSFTKKVRKITSPRENTKTFHSVMRLIQLIYNFLVFKLFQELVNRLCITVVEEMATDSTRRMIAIESANLQQLS